jgi:NAD(P)-dependent dehydrogenase (short-subunit alcohol dehydrogenase family)
MSKVWFITGAGSGIGAGICRAALKAGDRVVATARNLDKLRNALHDVTGKNLAIVQLDVTDEAQAKAAVEEAVKQFGRIDVAVNNAGYAVMGNFEERPQPTSNSSSQRTSGVWRTSCVPCCQSCASSGKATFLTLALSLA